jgi:hypothetical protein
MGVVGLGGLQGVILGEVTDSESASEGKCRTTVGATELTHQPLAG